MPTDEKITRLVGLLNIVKGQRNQFLKRCTDTKLLALSDLHQAIQEYCNLARTVLNSDGITRIISCEKALENVVSLLENGSMNKTCIETLQDLRSEYVERILRPTVKEYIESGSQSLKTVNQLYKTAFMIDGLLRVAQFLYRLSET